MFRNPSPSKRGLLKDPVLHSPHSGSRPSHLLQLQRYFCSSITLCCRVLQWRSSTPFPELIFRGGSFHSFGRLVRKVSELIENLGIGPTHSLAPTVQCPSETALFLVIICSRGFADYWEGEIFSDRIRISLGRSIGGGILSNAASSDFSIHFQFLSCSCYPATPTFCRFCIF